MDSQSTTAQDADPDTTRAVGAPSVNPATDPRRKSETIGRYVVLEQIGKGGMGVVYAAYDPELDRRIALKLVHARGREETATRGQARLLREAQALARLSHPNVVAVHDAGTAGDEVFVAMDFVEGTTLGKWLKEGRRDWKEILAVMLPAGRGLAAAHAAGLVHRDFKPANLIVGEQGRVHVIDFGLALAEQQVESMTSGSLWSSANMLDSRMTQTGLLMGTPAYMAPEQFRGAPADARSDQFSYCVALYEALYGSRPYPGNKVDDIRKSLATGEVTPGDGSRYAPPWVHRALLTGLSVDPAGRFEGMDALLAAIGHDPRAGWRRIGLGVGVAALAVVAVYGYARPMDGAQALCAGAESKLEGVWDDARRSEMTTAFSSTGQEWAITAGDKTSAVLDAYATEWSDGHQDACEATNVRGEQSYSVLDLRMRCLDRRRKELGALVDRLVEADDELIARAVGAAHELGPIDSCADLETLGSQVPLPDTTADREEVERLRAELADARTDLRAARYQAGLATIEAAGPAVGELGYRPLQAELALLTGRLYYRNGELSTARPYLVDAVMHAQAGGDLETMAHAWTEIVGIGSVANEERELARMGARHVAALIETLGGNPQLETELASGRGQLELADGNYDEALAQHQHAIEIGTERFGPGDPRVAQTRINLASVQHAMGQTDEAIENFATAIESLEEAYGPEHPQLVSALAGMAGAYADRARHSESRPIYERALRIIDGSLRAKHPKAAVVLNNLGGLEFAEENYEDAIRYFERTLRIYEESYGPRSQAAAKTTVNIGMVLERMGNYEAAIEKQQSAIEIIEAELGPEHPDLASPLQNLGDEHLELGRLDQALPYYERSLEVREKAFGKDHPRLGETLESLGRLQHKREDYEAALAAYARGVDVRVKGLGEQHPATASILTNRARTYTAMKDWPNAIADLERAIRAAEGTGFPRLEARAHFELSKVLWTSRDRERARDEVARARRIADEMGEAGVKLRERMEEWP